MKASPSGRLAATVAGLQRQSTGPPTVASQAAAAPLKMGPKNGSIGISSGWLHAATKPGAKIWRACSPAGDVNAGVV